MTKTDWLKAAKEHIYDGSFNQAVKCINEVIELIKLDGIEDDYHGRMINNEKTR